MLLNAVVTTVLGLTTLVSAAPHPADGKSPAARGLVWEPKALKERSQKESNSFFDKSFFNSESLKIDIVDTTVIEVNDNSRRSEEDLTILVQAQIDINNGHHHELRDFRDNVRRNHYRNKNSNENIVIVVVTKIIDIRDESNRNTRYATRRINADNNGRNNFQTVIVQEAVAITIDSGFSQSFFSGYAPTGTASAGASIETVLPDAPYLNSNQSQLLPVGSSFPNFAERDNDPARIVEINEVNVFVAEISGSTSNSPPS